MGHHGKKDKTLRDRRPAVVIDTNVLVDAMCGFLDVENASRNPYKAWQVLSYCVDNHRICFTPATMKEFVDVTLDLKDKTDRGPSSAMKRIDFIKWVEARMTMVAPQPSLLRCRDRKDQMLLDAAVGARAEHLISRDADILDLRGSMQGLGYSFIHPADFLRQAECRVHWKAVAAQKRGRAVTATGQPVQGFKQRGHASGPGGK